MTAIELQHLLRERFPVENERHEWKEWHSLKSNVSGRKGEDLVSYVSALANMEGGCIVIGAKDRSLQPTGIADLADYTLENLPHRVFGKCPNLSTLDFHIEELRTTDTGAVVWIVHVPRHLPRKPVYAHDKAWQRDGDSLVELRDERLAAMLAEPLLGEDWSAKVVTGATLADLDPQALAMARTKFAERNTTKPWAAEVAGWSDAVFLDKARLTVNGGITRTALLLLGRPESAHALTPQPAQITWKLVAERAVEHFGPPFVLTTSEALARIRVVNIKLYPAHQLLPYEMPKYETRVILEALHNCIAHQDYERGERVVIEEHPGHLLFRNAGAFFDGSPEMYVTGERQPSRYRNLFLVMAMVNVGMIDTGGMGIGFMFAQQRQRYLPLPDFEESTATQTTLKVFGQALDENYSRLLMERSDLPIEQVVWLDRIQKRLAVDAVQAATLRRAGLVEGRKPNWHVSARVADITDRRAEYIRTRGLDDEALKRLVMAYIKEFKAVSGAELRAFILGKLPEVLTAQQKANKVSNLLTALRVRGLDGWRIEAQRRGRGSRWRQVKGAE